MDRVDTYANSVCQALEIGNDGAGTFVGAVMLTQERLATIGKRLGDLTRGSNNEVVDEASDRLAAVVVHLGAALNEFYEAQKAITERYLPSM